MRLNKQRLLSLAAVCGTLALAGIPSTQAGEPSAPGVVRITDRATGIQQTGHHNFRLVSPHHLMNKTMFHPAGRYTDTVGGACGTGNCGNGSCGNGSCGRSGCGLFGGCGCLKKIWDADVRYKKCKFGYFNPTGCGGGGCPWFGSYDIAYPANPQYFDSRDGKLYAAQGYGIPMAVPLAPNVRHGYNYGWGIPSSRRTPISNPAPHVHVINP